MLHNFCVLHVHDVHSAWIVSDDAVVHDLAGAYDDAVVRLLIDGGYLVGDSCIYNHYY